MNLHLPFFHRQPREREVVAGLRDQIIEIVRFFEADRLAPRDDAGRFVSKRELLRQKMADACSHLTPEQREAAKARAMQGKAS